MLRRNGPNGIDLRVGFAVALVPAFSNDLSLLYQQGADLRIGRYMPGPQSGKVETAPHVQIVHDLGPSNVLAG